MLKGVTDFLVRSGPASSLDALCQLATFRKQMLAEFQSFLYNRFLQEDVLKGESTRQYMNPTVNSGVEHAGRAIWENRIVQYMPTNLLTRHTFEDDSYVWSGKGRAALHVWLSCLIAPMAIEENAERLYMVATGGRYLLSRKDFKVHCGNYDFEVRPGQSPGFLIVTGEEGAFLYVCQGLHLFVSYGKQKLLAPACVLEMKEVSISQNSV